MQYLIFFWKRMLALLAGLWVLTVSIRSLHWVSATPVASLIRYWKHLSHFKRGVFWGLLFAVLTLYFHDSTTLRKIDDAGMDWMIQMYRGVLRGDATNLRPITYLDIDEETYRSWDEPLSVPRSKLQRLIKYAVDGRASLIIVDVELSKETDKNADSELKLYLENPCPPSNASPSDQRPLCTPPHILLARGLRMSPGTSTRPRPSFLDESVVPEQRPYLHWASSLFDQDGDGVIRRWHLWEPVCDSSPPGPCTKATALSSFQLLALAILATDSETLPRLNAALNALASHGLADPAKKQTDHKSSSLKIGNVEIELERKPLGSRIIYSLPYPREEGEVYPLVKWNKNQFPLLKVVSAKDAADEPPIFFDDRIVIIGSSFADSRDIYYTPLGQMPGSMVIANALVSLQTGQATEWHWAARLAIEFLLIIGTAFAFSRFNGFRAKLVATGVTLLITLPLSFFLFRTGVWLDFAIPLAVVELHASISEVEKSLSTHGDHS